MNTLDSINSVGQMRYRASKCLPRAVFDFIDGGADDELTLQLNRQAFSRVLFTPAYLRDVSSINLACEILGQPSRIPLIIAPTGLSGVAMPDAEILLAQAAKAIGIPHTLSTFASCDIETTAEVDVPQRWFQVYILKNREITLDLIDRAAISGYKTLVVTVDVPVAGKRQRDWENGFTVPLKLTPSLCLDMLRNPKWSLRTLKNGVPTTRSMLPYAKGKTDSVSSHAAWVNSTFDPAATWDDLDLIRKHWAGKLVVKGIMTCQDADRAAEAGVDGIVVSNHGGRQLDGTTSSLDALAIISEHLRGQIPLILDSGIRRGSDIAKAMCLGASAVMIGRPTLYGVAVAGQAGAEKVLSLLQDEMERTLALLGVNDVKDLDSSWVHNAASSSSGGKTDRNPVP